MSFERGTPHKETVPPARTSAEAIQEALIRAKQDLKNTMDMLSDLVYQKHEWEYEQKQLQQTRQEANARIAMLQEAIRANTAAVVAGKASEDRIIAEMEIVNSVKARLVELDASLKTINGKITITENEVGELRREIDALTR